MKPMCLLSRQKHINILMFVFLLYLCSPPFRHLRMIKMVIRMLSLNV